LVINPDRADAATEISAAGTRFNETYTGYALSLCDAAAACGKMNFHRGPTKIWAAVFV